MFRRIRLLYRLFFAIFYTLYIVGWTALRGWLLGTGKADAQRIRQGWARHLLYTVGLRVTSSGTPPDFPCIIMCNHRSYLDPIVLLRDVRAVPVSKAEVSKWPLLGRGAQQAGILYLKREHGGSRTAMLRAIADTVLKEGFPIILFPEGTTAALEGTLPFKPGSFQLAARLGIPIVPVAIEYDDPEDYWVGKESFGSHASRRFKNRYIAAQVVFGPALSGDDAKILCDQTYDWINQTLKQLKSKDA
jgi:lyso-ornithine lipid O-acyltransferase